MLLPKFLVIVPFIFLVTAVINLFAGNYMPGKGKFLNIILLIYSVVLSFIGIVLHNRIGLPYEAVYHIADLFFYKVTITLRLDFFGLALIFLLSFCVLISEIFNANIEGGGWRGKRYSVYFGLAYFALYLLVISGNIAVMYACLEILALAAFGILSLQGRHTAGLFHREWMCVVFSSSFLMAGMAGLFQYFGTLNTGMIAYQINNSLASGRFFNLSVYFFIAGILIRLGFYPFYQLQHSFFTKSEPFSGIIYFFALTGASIIFLFKLNVVLLGLDSAAGIIRIAGLANMLIYGAAAAVSLDLKKVVSYLVGAQAGLLVFLFGSRLCADSVFFIFMFFLSFTAVLAVAYSVIQILNSSDISAMGALAKRMPLTAIILFFICVSMAFTPLMPHYLGARDVFGKIFFLRQPESWLFLVYVFLSAAAVMRLCVLVFFGRCRDVKLCEVSVEPPAGMYMPALLSVTAAFLGGYFLVFSGNITELSGSFINHAKNFAPVRFGSGGPLDVFACLASLAGIAAGWFLGLKFDLRTNKRLDKTEYISGLHNKLISGLSASTAGYFIAVSSTFEKQELLFGAAKGLLNFSVSFVKFFQNIKYNFYAQLAGFAELSRGMYSGRIFDYVLTALVLAALVVAVELILF